MKYTQISPVIFRTEDRTYRVEKKKWGQRKFNKEHAYLLSKYNDFVYPYRGKVDNIEFAHQVGIYIIRKDNNRIFIVRPKTDYDKKVYNIKRLITLTPDIIFHDLRDDINDLPEINISEGDIFAPQINNDDDIALAGLKYAIGQKKIDFNAYAHRFDSTATKNNGRRALTHGNTLKMEMMNRFCQVFDINAAILYWDKDGCTNPMSDEGKKVFIIFNDEEIDLKDQNITIEQINKR